MVQKNGIQLRDHDKNRCFLYFMNILSNIAVFLMYTDVHTKETLCSNVFVKKWFFVQFIPHNRLLFRGLLRHPSS